MIHNLTICMFTLVICDARLNRTPHIRAYSRLLPVLAIALVKTNFQICFSPALSCLPRKRVKPGGDVDHVGSHSLYKAIGTHTPTHVPRPGALSMVRVPPIFVTRSCIERMPKCPGKGPAGSKPRPLSHTSRVISRPCRASRNAT